MYCYPVVSCVIITKRAQYEVFLVSMSPMQWEDVYGSGGYETG